MEPTQPTLAVPMVVSGTLHQRYADVEALLHREGFLCGAAWHPPTPAALSALLQAMGHGEGEGGPPLEHTGSLVLPLAGRRCLRTGVALELPAAPALQACAARVAALLLGAMAGAHPRCLLVPAGERTLRASSTLLAELVAPVPPPRLPVSATLEQQRASRASSRGLGSGGGAATPRSASSLGAAQKGGECLVSLEEVLSFVFPPGALHPRSMGRLILYALQGPLRGGALVGGRLALARPLSDREVDTEIDALEEEDVLAAFTGGSVLGGSVEPVLRSVRQDGALHMPRMSMEQVEGLLAPVVAACDAPTNRLYARGALLSFHGLQAAVLRARALRVADLARAFPPAILPHAAHARLLPAPPILGRNALAPALLASTAPLAAALGATRRGPHTSAECWEKQGDIARGRKVEGLLHTRLQQVARELLRPIASCSVVLRCAPLFGQALPHPPP